MNTNTKHPDESRLNDHVDGLLSAAEHAEVEGHLADCAACRCEVDGLRRLIEEAAALGEIRPSRDLLPAIRGAAAPRRPARVWWGAMAASVLLLTASAVVLVLLRGGVAPQPSGPLAREDRSSEAQPLAELREAEREYREASARLLELLDARREALSPETLALVEDNVAIIDRAIEETRLALQRETPATADAQILTALYHKKLQLLWKISRLPS